MGKKVVPTILMGQPKRAIPCFIPAPKELEQIKLKCFELRRMHAGIILRSANAIDQVLDEIEILKEGIFSSVKILKDGEPQKIILEIRNEETILQLLKALTAIELNLSQTLSDYIAELNQSEAG